MKQQTMQKIEHLTIGLVLGAIPVIACFLAGWWISIPLVPESRIFLCALAGILLGLLLDALFLRRWIQRAYSMKLRIWMAVYVFYSVGTFGFFMGFPAFNVMLALPAGIFVGRWLVNCGTDSAHMEEAAQRTAIWTTSMLGLVCVASSLIALVTPSTASELRGMLMLPFQVTRPMLLGIILGGGTMILVAEWWITVQSVKRAYAYFVAHAIHPSPTPT